MIRNSRRVVTLAVAGAVAIAPVISGCGAGMTPQSAAPTRLTDGVNAQLPAEGAAQISLRNMFILGPEPGAPVPTGTSLALYGLLINQVEGEGDTLVSVSSPLFSGARIEGGSLALPAAEPDGEGGVTKLLGQGAPTPGTTRQPGGPGDASETPTPAVTGPGSTASPTGTPTEENTAEPPATPQPTGATHPLVVLEGLKQQLLAGAPVPIRLQFKNAGAIELRVPLVTHQEEYATYPLVSPAQPAQPGTTSPTPENGQSPDGAESPGTESPAGTESPGGTEQSPGAPESPATGEGAASGH
ncbi:hypothetical protein [Actinomadura algeriensis]|uniref:Copper(I)-binding protein n=1 Tax=Actinomadura algeriensis TaxID=1679523 RepID=A0ABR9JSZ4_9ACTN|nr:hypothetical protein [Actinomadura algeriensis]MBE1533476.1 copper(I)-binding protein [Actinomadura algeriensis]